MLNKKFLISVSLAVVLVTGAILGFVVIPAQLGKFRAASWIAPSATVSGNGGAAVMVGDYLYFTDGFKSKQTYEYKENEYNKVRDENMGAIWRVYMPNGVPNYDDTALRNFLGAHNFADWEQRYNSSTDFDDYKNQVIAGSGRDGNLELIVPKIAGWESTAIYVYGDTLVYTTPNNQKDRHGQLQNERIDFFKCDLRGRSHQKIYTTRTDGVGLSDFTVVYTEGSVYLLVHDGTSIYRIDTRGRVTTVADNVASFAFPMVTTYIEGISGLDNSFSGIMGYAYFTKDFDKETDVAGRQNSVWGYKITDKAPVKLFQNEHYHRFLSFGNGRLMFQTQLRPSSRNEVYVTDDPTLKNNQTIAQGFLQNEEVGSIFVSGERTVTYRYITMMDVAGTKLIRVYDPANPHAIRQITVGDYDKVACVTPNTFMYVTQSGGINTIYYGGTGMSTEDDTIKVTKKRDAIQDSRITVFRSNTGVYMAFYVSAFTEMAETDSENNPIDENFSPLTLYAGAIVKANGDGEYILARFKDKYIAYPDKPVL